MYVNTGGGGKTQQQQTLQNQTNASVRHNNPYQQSHAQQQPHYEHQTQLTFVYPYCNVGPPSHANTGGNNVAVGGGQQGHVLFQPQHQPQPHPTQQQIGLHNTEQTMHYFTKSAPMPAHHLQHPQQPHTQLRSMIAAVPHQRQPYMVPNNFFPFPHALLPQQSRASILANAAAQHAVAAASGGPMATQLQNNAPRNVPPNGPTTYVPPSYCNPPLLMGTAPAAVTPQPASMLTAATGLVQQPSLQTYAHMSGGLPTAPTPSAPINIQNVGIETGTSSNTEHTTNINTNTKQRKHAIPIRHPITMEIVPLEDLVDSHPNSESQSQLQTQFQPQTQIKTEINVESVSIQTDNDKSLTASITSDLSDIVPPTCSHSSSAVEADQINIQLENEECAYDIVKQESVHAVEATTLISVLDANTTTKSFQSHSESLKNCTYEDPNDTDADTNEHELDNEDILDAKDGNLSVSCTDQDLASNLSKEQQIEEVPKTDLVILQAGESDTEHTTETEIKSNEEPFTISVQTSLDRNDEVISKEIHEDLQTSTPAFVVTESKRSKKNRKGKNKERNQKNLKQQQNKSSNVSTQKDENNVANSNVKAAACTENKPVESKIKNTNINLPKKEDLKPTFIRYSLAELKALAKSSESRKTPVVPCQKGDCIAQLFVARQLHPQYLSHQSQNASTINVQHHVQQSYHQMDFNESMEFVTGKRRSVAAGGGVTARKHQEHHINLASTGNNNPGLQSTSGTTGIGCASVQMQKKMPVIRINLSLNEEIKLSECKNAWQPKILANNSNNNVFPSELSKNDNGDLEDVLKKVRGILNKLTSENFDVLLKEMTGISINTTEKMQNIMLLIFEKTVSEPNFAPTYAKFCKVLFDEIKAESKEGFNVLLIKRLENEFDSNVNNADAKDRKLKEIIQKLNDATDPQEKVELQAELEHQEYQFRRRAWGTVRFIGEMFKLRSVSANRVMLCLESLLEHGNEEKLEYMCKLLTTVGNLLESNESKSFINVRMNNIFAKMQTIVKEAKEPGKKKIKICSRVRFMMQDLIDLRSKNWGQASYAQSSQVAPRRRLPEEKSSNLPTGSANSYERGSSQRMSFGNNNRQNQSRTKESGSYFMQNTKSSKSQYSGQREQQSIDLKKLNFSRGDDSSQATTKLGTSSVYMWRTISGRTTVQSNEFNQNDRASPTLSHKYPQKHSSQPQPQPQPQYWGAKTSNFNLATKSIPEPCSGKDNKQLLNHLMEEYLDCLPYRGSGWQEEVFDTWQKTNNNQQINLVYYVLIDYLHLPSTGPLERNSCANIFIYLMKKNVFNKTTFLRAYEQFAGEFCDLLMDVPNGCTYVFQFLGPFIHEHLLTFNDIWYANWRNDKHFTERFVNALIVYFIKEFGANYVRNLWNKELKLEIGPIFKSDHQHLRQFLVNNKLQFLYDSKAKPEIGSTNANSNSSAVMDQHFQRLETLLSSPNDSNLALDYINTNVNINSHFLKKLTRFLCCYYATTTKSTLSGNSRTSSATASKNSSTCSNTSSTSSTKNADSTGNVHLNIKAFRNNCLPLLRLCLDGHEYHELACLDSIVNGIQNEYDTNTAYELICGIFDLLYEFEVIAKESFEKWYHQRFQEPKESKIAIKKELWLDLKSYMEKLL